MAFMWEAAIGGAVFQEKAVAVPACSAEALCLYGWGEGGRRAPRPACVEPSAPAETRDGQCTRPRAVPEDPRVLQGPRRGHLGSFTGTARPSAVAACICFRVGL